MFQAGGNVPRIWFLVLDTLRAAWVCFGLPTVPRSIHGPGSGAGAIGTNASRWFCIALISVGAIAGHSPAGKKPEKAAASSEARSTAKGPAGPFGNPGALRRSPETLSVFHSPSFVFTLAPARACRNRSSGLPF